MSSSPFLIKLQQSLKLFILAAFSWHVCVADVAAQEPDPRPIYPLRAFKIGWATNWFRTPVEACEWLRTAIEVSYTNQGAGALCAGGVKLTQCPQPEDFRGAPNNSQVPVAHVTNVLETNSWFPFDTYCYTHSEEDTVFGGCGTPESNGGANLTYLGGNQCQCPTVEKPYWNDKVHQCVEYQEVIDRFHEPPKQCVAPVGKMSPIPGMGNPIMPLTGTKTQRVNLVPPGSFAGSLDVVYDTERRVPASVATADAAYRPSALASFGELWSGSLHKNLALRRGLQGQVIAIQSHRGGGTWLTFYQEAGAWVGPKAGEDRLMASGTNWVYIDANAKLQETYDSLGQLQTVHYADGRRLTYAYSDSTTSASIAPGEGLLMAVTDQSGRSVQFEYEQPTGAGIRIKRVIDPAGRAIVAAYDATGSLTQLTWPDNTTRQFVYERSDLPWALTGVIDEKSVRLSTYGYDAQGRAIETQWVGGADRFSVSYGTPPSWNIVETYDASLKVLWRDHYWQPAQGITVTRPNGSTSSLGSTAVLGMPRLASQSQPAGSGCAASTSTLTYDANGNKTSEDDFNGKRICYANDLSRNLETARVEGLAGGASGAACSGVIGTGVSLPAGSRKVSTDWHPDWRLPVRQAEPGRITFSIYHGQPDPFNGGTLASCAPASAVLPSGKPIAVLCKQVEQATTDTDGHLGFAAGLQGSVPNRVRSWTYNATGQVLTETNPRNQTTTYAYYTDTTADHTLGDLQRVTNAVTQTTTFNKYDKNGLLLQSTDANGVVTINAYDPRGRLLTASVAGQTTSYTYDPVGQLTRITLPDTSWIGYEYDTAHRRTATLDSQGNRIEYALDNQGNVTAQTVKDPGGALRRALGQVIDALGRVQQTTGGV